MAKLFGFTIGRDEKTQQVADDKPSFVTKDDNDGSIDNPTLASTLAGKNCFIVENNDLS